MRIALWLALAVVLIAGARLHWVEADLILIEYDDLQLMDASHKIAAGDWGRLWRHQNIHWVPLYRLVRLPFDLNFPLWSVRFHALVVAAHLAGAAFLFLLTRRYLRSPWAALVTGMLFAWSTVGDEAIVWKAAAPFVFSWTLVLAGAWCLGRNGRLWRAAALAALLGAVSFFSGVLFVIPGLAAGILLLEPGARRATLAVSAAAWSAGLAAWLGLVASQESIQHYWEAAAPTASVATRFAWAASDTWNAYVYQLVLGVRLPYSATALLAAGTLALALILLRRHFNSRLALTFLLMTLPMLFVTVLIRRDVDVWKISRYSYQSFTFWAVALGALLDAILSWLEAWPGRRKALLALLPIPASLYLAAHAYVVDHHREAFRSRLVNLQAFWFGWDSFFRLASAHRVELGRPLFLPFVRVQEGFYLPALYNLFHPRRLPGLTFQHGVAGTPEQQEEFRQELERARARSPVLRQLPLPHMEAAPEAHVH